jgi:hypothetical protein
MLSVSHSRQGIQTSSFGGGAFDGVSSATRSSSRRSAIVAAAAQ